MRSLQRLIDEVNWMLDILAQDLYSALRFSIWLLETAIFVLLLSLRVSAKIIWHLPVISRIAYYWLCLLSLRIGWGILNYFECRIHHYRWCWRKRHKIARIYRFRFHRYKRLLFEKIRYSRSLFSIRRQYIIR